MKYGTALAAALLLGLAAPADAAKCIHDPNSAKYPEGWKGYNDQTGADWFFVAVNSRISADGYELLWNPDGPETAPPLHWEFKSLRLSWDSYGGTDFGGYLVLRSDYVHDGKGYADAHNAWERASGSSTTATRPAQCARTMLPRTTAGGSTGSPVRLTTAPAADAEKLGLSECSAG